MKSKYKKVVLVTGSTDGVGRCVAETLGRAGYTILVHGRDRHRADAAVAGIKAAGGQATAYLADFSSLADVRLLANRIVERHPVIDAVINNAGVGFGPPGGTHAESKDGHELRFAVNYLAPFLLTYLMPTAMAREPGIRPLNTVEEGARAIVQLVTAPQWPGQSGLYFDGTRPAQAHAQAYDPEARSRLRLLSFELVRLGQPDEHGRPGVGRPGHSHTAAFPSSEDISIRN